MTTTVTCVGLCPTMLLSMGLCPIMMTTVGLCPTVLTDDGDLGDNDCLHLALMHVRHYTDVLLTLH